MIPEAGVEHCDSDPGAGHAVLVWTDHARHWGHPAYFEEHPALTADAAERLLASGYSVPTGKLRSSSMAIMVSPTAPVAPTTATS